MRECLSQSACLTCSFSCVSSSNSFSASASEWSLSRRSGDESSQESCTSVPVQAPCSSQPCWEIPFGGFTLTEDSDCLRSKRKEHIDGHIMTTCLILCRSHFCYINFFSNLSDSSSSVGQGPYGPLLPTCTRESWPPMTLWPEGKSLGYK